MRGLRITNLFIKIDFNDSGRAKIRLSSCASSLDIGWCDASELVMPNLKTKIMRMSPSRDATRSSLNEVGALQGSLSEGGRSHRFLVHERISQEHEG